MSLKVYPVLIICLLSTSLLFAEQVEKESSKKITQALFPYALYTSETGFSIGLVGSINASNLLSGYDIASLISSLQYTQKNQIALALNTDYQTKEKEYQTGLSFSYKYWPDDFYGIGIASKEEEKETYVAEDFGITCNIRKRIYQNWSIGLIIDYVQYRLELDEQTPNLLLGDITGSKGGEVIGSGLTLTRDKRNRESFTTRGEYLEIRASFYDKRIRSDYNYVLYTIDYRKYYQLSDKSSIAWQFFSGHKTEEVPFQEMFQLGDFLRAFKNSRYIDRTIALIRSEYRVFPWKGKLSSKMGFVCFIESGTVLDEIVDWSFNKQKISLGGGLRFKLIDGEGLVLRFDAGISKNSLNIIFIAREAF